MSDDDLSPSPPRLLIACLLLGAFLARLAVMLPALDAPLQDPDNYLPLAEALARGDGLSFRGRPTAYRPPLYPLVLAPLTTLPGKSLSWGIRALHLALGVGTVGLVMRAARGWGLSPARVATAGAIVAFDPVLVSQARAVMTETLAAFLVALALMVLTGSESAPIVGPLRARPGPRVPLPSEPTSRGVADRARRRDAPARLVAGTVHTRFGLVAGHLRGALAVGGTELEGRRGAGLDDHPRRLHPGPRQQRGLLRRCAPRADRNSVVRTAAGGLVRLGQPPNSGTVRTTGRPRPATGRPPPHPRTSPGFCPGVRGPAREALGGRSRGLGLSDTTATGHRLVDHSTLAGPGRGAFPARPLELARTGGTHDTAGCGPRPCSVLDRPSHACPTGPGNRPDRLWSMPRWTSPPHRNTSSRSVIGT